MWQDFAWFEDLLENIIREDQNQIDRNCGLIGVFNVAWFEGLLENIIRDDQTQTESNHLVRFLYVAWFEGLEAWSLRAAARWPGFECSSRTKIFQAGITTYIMSWYFNHFYKNTISLKIQ